MSARAVRSAARLAAACLWLALIGCDDHAGREHATAPDAAMSHAKDAGPTRDAAVTDAGSTAMAMDASMPDDASQPDATSMRSDAGDAGHDATAIAPPAPRDRLSLVVQKDWKPLAAADDPWSDRPASFECDPIGYGPEEFGTEIAYSIDTQKCAYLTVTQRTIDDVRAGEEVFVRVWHFALSGPDGAEAHVALTLDGTALLDEHIAIPADGGLLIARWTAPKPIAAGAPVLLHIHNHGANQYAFLELSTGAPQ